MRHIKAIVQEIKVVNVRTLCKHVGVDDELVMQRFQDSSKISFGDAVDTLITKNDVLFLAEHDEVSFPKAFLDAVRYLPDDVLIGLGS